MLTASGGRGGEAGGEAGRPEGWGRKDWEAGKAVDLHIVIGVIVMVNW